MIKKHSFKDNRINWNQTLRENFDDFLLFETNYIEFEAEYFNGDNESYFLNHRNEIAVIKIYNSKDKIYFSQIYFSNKRPYNLSIIKTLTDQILSKLFSLNKPKMHLKEYIHSKKSDIHFMNLSNKFILNPVFELWVDLNVDENSLWSFLRSNYRNLIKRNKKHITIKFPQNFDLNKYKNFHYIVSKRKTRSDLTWQYQKKMFEEEKLLVCEAYLNGDFIGFSFFNYTNYIGQYTTSVCERAHFNEYSVTHIMIWEALNRLREKGLKKFYLGFTRGQKINKTKVDYINLFKSGFASKIRKSWLVENEDDQFFETGIFK